MKQSTNLPNQPNLNAFASTFQPANENEINGNIRECDGNSSTKSVSAAQRCNFGRSDDSGKGDENASLVIVEVKDGNGSWVQVKCFLDTESNSSLVRSKFAKQLKLRRNGPCNIKFGIAGGGIHNGRAEGR